MGTFSYIRFLWIFVLSASFGGCGDCGGESTKPAAQKVPEVPKNAERSTSLAETDFVIPEEVPEEPADVAPKKKSVRKSRSTSWDCDGSLAVSSIQKTIASNRRQVRSCYEKQLKVNNILQGELILKLKIGSKGRVSAVSTSGSLRDRKVHACVKGRAKRWKFANPTGGCAVVSVPFNLAPSL